jgi:hypothetical protein
MANGYRARVFLFAILPVLAAVAAPCIADEVGSGAPAPVTPPPLPVRKAEVKDAAMALGFLRLVDHGTLGGRLESADVTYQNAQGVSVRLVSAIHIGERAYFEAIAKSFEGDEAVLYELVKPKDAAVPTPGVAAESGSGVREIQQFMKNMLNLEFQLDAIDYSKANFVHADLDAETFRKLQEERGETFEMLFFKQLMKAMRAPAVPEAAEPPQDPEQTLREMIRLVTRPDAERQIKLTLAKHMMDADLEASGFGEPGNNVIVTERNKAAMKTLADTMAKGQKKISIFYGAAHMPDFAQRLRELGFKPVKTEWRLAWDLAVRDGEPSLLEDLLIEGVKALSEGE